MPPSAPSPSPQRPRRARAAAWLAALALAACGRKAERASPSANEAATASAATASTAAVAPAPAAPDPATLLAIEASDAPRTSASVVVGRLRGKRMAWAADEEGQVHTFDLEGRRVQASTATAGAPTALLRAPDGRLLVALREASMLVAFKANEAGELVEVGREPTAAEPVAMAVAPDGATLLVTCRWGRRMQGFELASLRKRFEIELPRDPGAMALVDAKNEVYVAHVTGPSLSLVSLEPPYRVRALSARSTIFSLSGGEVASGIRDFRAPSQGFAVSVLDGMLLAPQVLMSTRSEGESYYGGTGDVPQGLFNVLRLATKNNERQVQTPHPSGDLARADSPEIFLAAVEARTKNVCPLPRASVVDPAAGSLLVACQGSDRLLELDARSKDPARAHRRWWPVAAGPVGLALDREGASALVWSAFARTLSVVPRGGQGEVTRLTVDAPSVLSDEVRRGREVFHASDERISSDGRACASCHPDGRDDGLIWSSTQGSRRTKLLAGRVAGSAPYGWDGEHKTLDEHIDHTTLKRLKGKGLVGPDRAALVAYLLAMKAPPQRPPADEERERIRRGKEIFASPEAMCAACHPSDAGFTDNAAHDVQSGPFKGMTFDTPSLHLVGGAEPYFHDGRYKTLRELLDKSDGKMGSTRHLDDDDKQALVAYLMIL